MQTLFKEYCEYFCQMPSKSILIILSYIPFQSCCVILETQRISTHNIITPISVTDWAACDAVSGCADLKLSTMFWIKRTDTEATVGCQANGRTWRLVCRGTSWLGDVGNCSGADDAALGGARLPTMTSAAYYISDDVDQTALDFTSSLPTGITHTHASACCTCATLFSSVPYDRLMFAKF